MEYEYDSQTELECLFPLEVVSEEHLGGEVRVQRVLHSLTAPNLHSN